MGWTKQDLLDQAFSEIGLSPDTFNVDPNTMAKALRSLDTMMATWNGKGIRLGYALPASPADSNSTDESGLPDAACEAVFLNLAIRIAPSVGKQVSVDTKASANQAYKVILSRASMPPAQATRELPSGAGNKPSRTGHPFLPATSEPLEAADGGDQIVFE